MDRLNFNHLYYFYIVANEGSIKEAALKLHVSQPTISDQIKLLEDHFNCLLFERKNRSLSLTEQGKLALKYSEKIFGLGSEITNRLRNNVEGPKKVLDIGITHLMGHYFLYDSILPLFKRKELSVNVKENERHLLLADLEAEKIDMVFTDTKDGITSSMDAYRIGVNRTFAIAHKNYLNNKKTFPKCLNSIPFFNYTNDTFLKYEIELFFSKSGISPKVIGEGNDIDLFQMITEQGLAFTIVPEVAKNRICRNQDVIVLGELDEFQTSVWGIIKKNYKGPGYKLLSKEK